MKKIIYILTILSSFAFANELNTAQEIADTKAQIAKLQASLEELESSLPVALAKKEDDEALKVHTEFGFVSTKGNTNTLNYSLDTKVQKSFGKNEWTFLADGEYTSDNDVRTKNKYFLELDYGYKLNEELYLEYITAYKFDEFSGYDYQVYTGPGLKYKVLNSETQTLDLSSALLFSKDKLEIDPAAYNYTSYRAKLEYSWQMFKNLKFEETLTYRTDVTKVEDYFVYSKTAFISKLSDIFSVSISYKIDYINMAAIGKDKTDKTLAANLIADF